MDRRDIVHFGLVIVGMGILVSVGIGLMILDVGAKKACQKTKYGKR